MFPGYFSPAIPRDLVRQHGLQPLPRRPGLPLVFSDLVGDWIWAINSRGWLISSAALLGDRPDFPVSDSCTCRDMLRQNLLRPDGLVDQLVTT